MSHMHTGAGLALLSTLFLTACTPEMMNGGMMWGNPWMPPPTPYTAPLPAPDVEIYKYQGSRQCENGGVPLASMRQQLELSGVVVTNSSCGMDGRMYPAFCGGADGRINIFTVTGETANLALGQGFALLSELPEAQRSACYSGGASSSSYHDNSNHTDSAGVTTYPYNGSGGDNSYYSYQ